MVLSEIWILVSCLNMPVYLPSDAHFYVEILRKVDLESFHFRPSYVIYTSLTHSNNISEQLICFHGNPEDVRI